MGKYFQIGDLTNEIRRELIQEFGSLQAAKGNMMIFTHHLPEHLQQNMINQTKQRYPYIEKDSNMYKDCLVEMNKDIKIILAGLYPKAS